MAMIINESTVAGESFGANAKRQRLLTEERVKGVKVLLDRLTLGANGEVDLHIPAASLAWFHILQGEAVLRRPAGTERLTNAHVALLPPGFRGALTASESTTLIYAEVPNAAALDPRFSTDPPPFRIIDWTREPVLDSKHDARKRVYVATPKLFGTKAIKAEIIFYPPGTSGSNHHHVGAEHFMYVIKGGATGHSNEVPNRMRAGDVVYHPDLERHYSMTSSDEEMMFIEFFVPGEFETVWANPNRVCTWIPTGRNSLGEKPAREIKAHDSNSAAVDCPQDV